MRNLLFSFFIFLFVGLSGGNVKSIKHIFPDNDFAFILLNDATIWKVSSAKVIDQTWDEWWEEKFPKQPEKEFISNFDDWEASSEVEIFPFDIRNFEAEKYHSDEIFKCNLILKNLKTKTCGFARRINIEELFSELSSAKCDCFLGQLKSEYYKGFRDGYVMGYEERDHKSH